MTDHFQNTAQPDRDWWETLWSDPSQVIERLGVDDDDSVVDICAGEGLFSIALAEQTDGSVYALELDTDHLAALEARADRAGVTVETMEADARDLDDALAEPVEFALLGNTFHGVADQKAFAETVRTALTDDGRFAVVNWHDRPKAETTVLGEERGPPTALRMTPEETTAIGTAAGFEVESVIDLPPYHYGVVFRSTADSDDRRS